MIKFDEKTLAYKFINGGIGYGNLCIPDTFVDLILIIVFPPLYVITYQVQKYLKSKNNNDSEKVMDQLDMGQIIMSLLFTSCFYFPGLLHAISIMKGKEKCGSVF